MSRPLPVVQAPPASTRGSRRGAWGCLGLSFPWLVFVLVSGLVVWDQRTARDSVDLTEVAAAAGLEVQTHEDQQEAAVARDVVCNMTVRRATAYQVTVAERTYFFCSTYCRDAVVAEPARWIQAHPPSLTAGADKHLMRGIPAWMYQYGVLILLLVSFGLFELLSWLRERRGAPLTQPALDARQDLLGAAWVRRLVTWKPLRFCFQSVCAAFFCLIIYAGLFGNQNPSMNVAPLLTWTIWWAGLIFLILYFGKLWCFVCPWDGIATWIERLKPWGPRQSGMGLGLRWPRKLRNIWPAVGLFVLLTWVELGLGVTMVPRVTAYLALGMLGMAVTSVLVFDRKAFCRYGCLVGRVSGLYALFSPIEVRSKDDAVCSTCRTMDCYKGNAEGDGCPTFEFPRTMQRNTYCISCGECLKTCPHGNTTVRLRPWASDLAQGGKGRSDEAFLAIVLLSMTGFHGLTMTPRWGEWSDAVQSSLAIPAQASFSLLMVGLLVLPVLLFALLSKATAMIGRVARTRTVFLRYAYALLPIALFYHLAHNAEHFLMEGPKLLALASDPCGWGWDLFGTAGWAVPPMITLEGLWILQVFFVVIGHLYGLWISERTTRGLVPDRLRGILAQIPMLLAMLASSTVSLWLLNQPMEMRVSAM
ncbi:MAG: hypothetical protein KDD82_25110 [Planctomycetes bacterium]|nr:hypothetical protein [Planctomycetota bacterium]